MYSSINGSYLLHVSVLILIPVLGVAFMPILLQFLWIYGLILASVLQDCLYFASCLHTWNTSLYIYHRMRYLKSWSHHLKNKFIIHLFLTGRIFTPTFCFAGESKSSPNVPKNETISRCFSHANHPYTRRTSFRCV